MKIKLVVWNKNRRWSTQNTDVTSETWRPGGACRRKQKVFLKIKSREKLQGREKVRTKQDMVKVEIRALEAETRRHQLTHILIHDHELWWPPCLMRQPVLGLSPLPLNYSLVGPCGRRILWSLGCGHVADSLMSRGGVNISSLPLRTNTHLCNWSVRNISVLDVSTLPGWLLFPETYQLSCSSPKHSFPTSPSFVS